MISASDQEKTVAGFERKDQGAQGKSDYINSRDGRITLLRGKKGGEGGDVCVFSKRVELRRGRGGVG